ncbi:MAG: class I SAM-dependent methyltransferase [Bacteroidota bacterium]
MNVKSPITHSSNVILERKIPASFIKEEYMSSYSIDVSGILQNTDEVGVYRCLDTDFRFYGPSTAAGDAKFYEELQKFPWYYMDWKWEHECVKGLLKKGESVLEIGCAEGTFIERIQKENISGVGLELNVAAAESAQNKGLNVLTQSIEDHAKEKPNHYDVVCSFQVMEHIADVQSVLTASVRALKKGGRLMISVPNNSSFIKYSPNSIMNMPPHHMCLWDEKSLSNLQSQFEITLTDFHYEPLQKYHFPVIWSNWLYKKLPSKFMAKAVNRISRYLGLYKLVGLRKNKIIGHSIIAVYTKN